MSADTRRLTSRQKFMLEAFLNRPARVYPLTLCPGRAT